MILRVSFLRNTTEDAANKVDVEYAVVQAFPSASCPLSKGQGVAMVSLRFP